MKSKLLLSILLISAISLVWPSAHAQATDGKIKGKIKSPGDKGIVIDVNTASVQDIIILFKTSQKTADAILAERSKKAFTSAEDFAARICTQHSIDSGFENSVKIQNEIHAPKSGDPKAAGWKCAVGQNTFEVAGRKHQYVGHVTLLR